MNKRQLQFAIYAIVAAAFGYWLLAQDHLTTAGNPQILYILAAAIAAPIIYHLRGTTVTATVVSVLALYTYVPDVVADVILFAFVASAPVFFIEITSKIVDALFNRGDVE